jgi:hypothetical protein
MSKNSGNFLIASRVYVCVCAIQCPGVLLDYPVPGGNKYRNLALEVRRVSKIETIKYAHESLGTQI